MLVSKSNSGTVLDLAERITLCLFPFPMDQYLLKKGVEFVQLLKDNQVFCYQFQFIMEYKEVGDVIRFKINHHCLYEDGIKLEKAVATILANLFEYKPNYEF